jgi:cobalamin biosynthesis protein CobT
MAIFETSLERLARVLARQHNIEVIFEGSEAKTDGEKIVLPYFEELTAELKADLNGFLDHEVAHCKFTEFKVMGKCKKKFHKMLLNAVEDTRIERLMIQEFPGTALHLNPLNEKLLGKIEAKRATMPWPIRIILNIRDIMEGRKTTIEEDIAKRVESIRSMAVALNKCESTEELRVATEAIMKKIIEESEEESKEDSKESKDSKDGKDGDSKDGKSGDKSGESYDGEKMMMEDAESGDPKGGDSEYDKHIVDAHSMINDEIKKEIKGDRKTAKSEFPDFSPKTSSIPTTTRFDEVTSHVGKGNPTAYRRLRQEVATMVSPIKRALERVLKVRENAKWRGERERGAIDARSLGKLAADRSYRTVFKDFTKTETNNVAVEILVDMSGSMGGAKMNMAKKSAIALAEALKDLQIPFEVTGFYSVDNPEMTRFSRDIENKNRYNRSRESLSLHVFKDFESSNLSGIEKLFVGVQNPDGECLAWAAKRLSARKEKRKILLVLSDGQPATADSNQGILASDLRKKVEKISKIGIECVGIGIMTDAVSHYYPDYIVISELKDLPKAAMGKLSKLIGGSL